MKRLALAKAFGISIYYQQAYSFGTFSWVGFYCGYGQVAQVTVGNKCFTAVYQVVVAFVNGCGTYAL